MAFRAGLLAEVVVMAFDTVRTNKMRSFLTVLGVVIGITSIVGMTALIRGFDQSLRDLIAQSGPNIIYLQKFGVTSFANGAEIRDLLKRPDLSLSDARALEAQNSTLKYVDLELGAGPGPVTQRKVFYRELKTKNLVVFGNIAGTGQALVPGLTVAKVSIPPWQLAGSNPVINTVKVSVTGYKFHSLFVRVFGVTFGDINGDIPYGAISATMRGSS